MGWNKSGEKKFVNFFLIFLIGIFVILSLLVKSINLNLSVFFFGCACAFIGSFLTLKNKRGGDKN